MRPRVVFAAALAALMAALSAGCGGVAGEQSERALPLQASARTLAGVARASARSDSARFTMAIEQSLGGLGAPLRLTLDGAFDASARRLEMRFDLSALAAAFGGKLGKASDWQMEALLDGTTMYIKLPAPAREATGGKPWVKADIERLAKLRGTSLAQLPSPKSQDPRAVLDALKAVAGKVERIGAETVRGVPTMHFRATLDPRKLRRAGGAAQTSSLGSWDELVRRTGLTSIPMEVWIDGESRLRRMIMVFSPGAQGGGSETTASLALELFDYGTKVEIDLPPADQVADAERLLGG